MQLKVALQLEIFCLHSQITIILFNSTMINIRQLELDNSLVKGCWTKMSAHHTTKDEYIYSQVNQEVKEKLGLEDDVGPGKYTIKG